MSVHIKEAIKRKKIHNELHPHSANFKPKEELIIKVRAENRQISQSRRYQIVSSKRACDSLVGGESQVEITNLASSSSHHLSSREGEIHRTSESSPSLHDNTSVNNNESNNRSDLYGVESISNDKRAKGEDTGGNVESGGTSDKVFHIFDVEQSDPSQQETEVIMKSIDWIKKIFFFMYLFTFTSRREMRIYIYSVINTFFLLCFFVWKKPELFSIFTGDL